MTRCSVRLRPAPAASGGSVAPNETRRQPTACHDLIDIEQGRPAVKFAQFSHADAARRAYDEVAGTAGAE